MFIIMLFRDMHMLISTVEFYKVSMTYSVHCSGLETWLQMSGNYSKFKLLLAVLGVPGHIYKILL